MKKMIPVFSVALLALVLFAGGCAPDQSGKSSVPTVPTISDDTYTNQISDSTKYRISHDGRVNVFVDAEGVVIVTGSKINNSLPDVKVSGEGVKYRVVSCGNVIADEGTIIEAYSCYYVKVRNKAKVSAYACNYVYALPDAEILKTQGCESVQQVKKPSVPVNTAPASTDSNSTGAANSSGAANSTGAASSPTGSKAPDAK